MNKITNITIEEKLWEIQQCLAEHLPKETSPGLMNGRIGSAIYLAYLKKTFNDNKYDDTIEQYVVEASNLRNHRFLSFCNGTSGVLWGIQFLKHNDIIDLDDNFEQVYEYVAEHALREVEQSNIDYLHGAMGNMLSIVDWNYEVFAQVEDQFLSKLQAIGEEDSSTIKWETDTQVTIDQSFPSYNTSLSHGISSIIILLAEIHRKNPSNKLAESLLIKATNHLLGSKNTEPIGSRYPTLVHENGEKSFSSKLAWCYGDIGVGLALLNSGSALNDDSIIKSGADVLLWTTKLKTHEETGIIDPCFCHGTAGLANVYRHAFKTTGHPKLEEASWYWLDQTLKMATHGNNNCAGYTFYNGIEKRWEVRYGTLEGLTGIALTLLSFLSSKEFGWERGYLIR